MLRTFTAGLTFATKHSSKECDFHLVNLPSFIAGMGPLGAPELLILLVLAAAIVAPLVVIVGVVWLSRRTPKPPPLPPRLETLENVRDKAA